MDPIKVSLVIRKISPKPSSLKVCGLYEDDTFSENNMLYVFDRMSNMSNRWPYIYIMNVYVILNDGCSK